ncbi:MAG TPA: glycosyltransferase family 2 protein [Candidatus Acidoferrum sp.]|nr:glycosyltransferase family 2 protein [Candidatus Acidoferrum sp.]
MDQKEMREHHRSDQQAVPLPLAVVMPAYNEQESIEAAVDEVRTEILGVVPGAELWVVDDGSRDLTASVLDRVAAGDRRIHVLSQRNAGHGAAVLAGLRAADAEWLMLIDSDRQIPLAGFGSLWEARRGVDCILGRRSNRHDPLARRLVTLALKAQVWLVFGARVADPNAPFKLISRELWHEAWKVIPATCLIPSVFIALFARRAGFRCLEVEVAYRQRQAGRTSLRNLKLLKFSARSFVQLLGFRAIHVRVRRGHGLPQGVPVSPS